ncbi:MAG: DUF1553 domain-containing protein [Pirellulales bacterium]
MQSLTTLNDPAYVEAAQALARRVRADAKNDTARLDRMFRLVVSRPTDGEERERLLTFYAGERTQFLANIEAAKKLGGPLDGQAGSEKKTQDDKNAKSDKAAIAPATPEQIAEQAAWTTLANVLLNLDEALVK